MNENARPTEMAFTDASLRELMWLGDQIPGGFFIYRADGSQELVYVNQATLRIFGCVDMAEFTALTDNTFRGMVHPEDYDDIQSSIDHQITADGSDQMDYVEYRIVRKDGEVRWVDDYGHFAQMPGYGDVYYVFIMDVTDKRRIQAEKMQAEMALAREKQASELKDSFLFNISHDIRTPMNAVIGFSELARRHMDDHERLAEYLDKTTASGKQLLSLIDDMLEMNQLNDGKIVLSESPVDLKVELTTTAELFRGLAEQKNIIIETNINLPAMEVLTDCNRFRRIISNLMDNAVKFTPAGGRVALSARQMRTSETGGYARYEFVIQDTGIGMSDEFMGRMFDAFEREGNSTATGMTGMGLGLSIVKSLLDLMGGTITAKSKKGVGTAFTVALPMKLASGGVKYEAPVSEPVYKKEERRLLIVEDIELNRELAQTLLEEEGFLVEAVPDGCDAVDAVRGHGAGYYDLILMDIQMPVMNGYEATRAIRALPREDCPRIPIVALSANARDEDRRLSMAAGMNAHVAKPFDIDGLVKVINGLII